ncbi:DUF3093 domain-containing protein [Kineosporia succinea]|uniref:DUF3093 family protein n=1 Tax=Kineosporia succinea TaxID=84632 RepID=A0ABT9NVT2_9ACTN|nr:DUF3093 domain-containing protein [Kineosporia succinea]MDP9824531.1 hypothetical protein [Kineosporia succinea]
MSSDQQQKAKVKRLEESLSPSPAMWFVFVLLGASFGLIPGPINTTVALVTSVLCVVLTVGLVVGFTPRLSLAKGVFAAGRAKVPASLVAKVEPLDAAQMRAAHGVDLDARAYLCTRAWVRTGIRVTLDDPADPTPYWLISTRRPQEWVRALGS